MCFIYKRDIHVVNAYISLHTPNYCKLPLSCQMLFQRQPLIGALFKTIMQLAFNQIIIPVSHTLLQDAQLLVTDAAVGSLENKP